jgi:hypothetical protein
VELSQRIERYRRIEEYRKRPLIVYATSTRQNASAMMAGDAVREFIDQVDAIPSGKNEKGGRGVDILIHSAGGDALTAWKLMSILRERFERVGVLVPLSAFSAATVFALGADEIVMHPHASLGPIDPQISVRGQDGTVRQFAYEDLGAFLRFLHQDVGLTEQVHISSLADRLFASVDPVLIGAAKRASDLSAEVGERLLKLHMKDDRRARQIAINLNKSFFAHGDAVSRSRAQTLDLPVAKTDPELEKLLWDAYLGIEGYMQLREPINPLDLFLSRTGKQVGPVQIQLPPNVPPQMAQQMTQQFLAATQVEVPFRWVKALVESPRLASEVMNEGFIVGSPQMATQLTVVDRGGAWKHVQVPTKQVEGPVKQDDVPQP